MFNVHAFGAILTRMLIGKDYIAGEAEIDRTPRNQNDSSCRG